MGRFSLRDIAIAAGTLSAGEEAADKPKPTIAVIDLAFGETDKDVLEATAKAAEEGSEALKAIDDCITAKCGSGKGPDLSPFRTMLKDAALQVRRRLNAGEAAAAGHSAEDAGPGAAGAEGGRLTGGVSSSVDVEMALDKIIRYYEQWEPSSPVPLIVQCAKQMVRKKFLDITKVLTPDAIGVLERISTPPADSPPG
jgi:type VI secretion system protein ImpA